MHLYHEEKRKLLIPAACSTLAQSYLNAYITLATLDKISNAKLKGFNCYVFSVYSID